MSPKQIRRGIKLKIYQFLSYLFFSSQRQKVYLSLRATCASRAGLGMIKKNSKVGL
jgi:hypothetical protein